MTIKHKQNITPYEFTTRWNELIKDTEYASTDADGHLIGLWPLVGRKIKRRKVVYDDCIISVRMLNLHPNYVQCQIGLIHETTKPCGPFETHWRVVMLSEEDIQHTTLVFSKIVIQAANSTNQGKLEPDVCLSIMDLIEQVIKGSQ